VRIIRPALLVVSLLVLTRCNHSSAPALISEGILHQIEPTVDPPMSELTVDPPTSELTVDPLTSELTADPPTSMPTWTATILSLPTRTRTVTPTPTATATPSPAPTITPSAGALAIPRLDLNPEAPIPYLETFRLLTYYGSPTGWGLGILGESPRADMTQDLRARALQLQALSPNRFVLPTYHMVTTVADKSPGPDENYSHQVGLEMLEEWIEAANENGVAAILDIQPARADIQEEFDRIKHLLHHPHVHLALDPEFIVTEEQIPSTNLGQIQADQINAIQAQLNGIALEIGINRVLIIHQFEDEMVIAKDQLTDFAHVELVIDADGVGGKGSKLFDYRQYAQEPGFEYGGIKVFTRHDAAPLLTLEEIMALEPPPAIVIYQ
jgi:hypothetical protein